MSREAYYQRKNEERKKEKELSKANSAAAAADDEVPATKVETKGAVMFFKGSKDGTTREDIKVP